MWPASFTTSDRWQSRATGLADPLISPLPVAELRCAASPRVGRRRRLVQPQCPGGGDGTWLPPCPPRSACRFRLPATLEIQSWYLSSMWCLQWVRSLGVSNCEFVGGPWRRGIDVFLGVRRCLKSCGPVDHEGEQAVSSVVRSVSLASSNTAPTPSRFPAAAYASIKQPLRISPGRSEMCDLPAVSTIRSPRGVINC